MTHFDDTEARARALDAEDPLAAFRERFFQPWPLPSGEPTIYFCGNSLGLQPKDARATINDELDAWATLAVEGHFKKDNPWAAYDECLKPAMAGIVGAYPEEIAIMNGLTVNLHLLMVSFYRPTTTRFKILMEANAFPSDRYAVASQAGFHGFPPDEAIIEAAPRPGEDTLRTEDVVRLIERRGGEIALVLFSGVNYLTGQWFDIDAITHAARRAGCVVGFDLAHAAGNVPVRLHEWDVDFAVWCTYKYLNAGPGSVAGCFVHERHRLNPHLPRFAGWWGTDANTRFEMRPEFSVQPGAAGWQVSNLPIFSMAALKASLDLFAEAGMPALRRKSETLTGYLRFLLEGRMPAGTRIVTPPDAQGCQLSLRVIEGARETFRRLEHLGVVGDFREPDVIRVAPVPLYNSFHEVWRFAQKWRAVTGAD